jgi:hypothetical protein
MRRSYPRRASTLRGWRSTPSYASRSVAAHAVQRFEPSPWLTPCGAPRGARAHTGEHQSGQHSDHQKARWPPRGLVPRQRSAPSRRSYACSPSRPSYCAAAYTGFILEKKFGLNQPTRIENARILIANTRTRAATPGRTERCRSDARRDRGGVCDVDAQPWTRTRSRCLARASRSRAPLALPRLSVWSGYVGPCPHRYTRTVDVCARVRPGSSDLTLWVMRGRRKCGSRWTRSRRTASTCL